jgi:hypothetical protein
MTALLWGIKSSLIDYVRGRGAGTVVAADGATAEGGAFRFPAGSGAGGADGAFLGSVTLTAHSGMFHLVIAEPAIVHAPEGWRLEIADPHEPGARLPFATIAAFDGERATGTVLTQDGADLFFGPYEPGTPIDEPTVVEAEPESMSVRP